MSRVLKVNGIVLPLYLLQFHPGIIPHSFLYVEAGFRRDDNAYVLSPGFSNRHFPEPLEAL